MKNDFEKVKKILDSCLTIQQSKIADNCFRNFYTKWSKIRSIEVLNDLGVFKEQYINLTIEKKKTLKLNYGD